MRTPIVAGNWKMNTTLDEAIALVEDLVDELDSIEGVEKVLCPPFISLASVKDYLEGTSVDLGAQDLFYEDRGAYTGEISPLMLEGLCEYAIVGHSERRQYCHEDDETVARKVRAALQHGIVPIACIGENLQENEAGRTTEVVTRQMRAILAELPAEQASTLVVAYEPIWAIGTGKAATGRIANEVIATIRATIGQEVGPEVAARIRIQYGGSVTAANIAEFMEQPEVDGALVGGASLKPEEFVSIVFAAAQAGSKG